MTDLDAEALAIFRADMLAQGLSVREYERKYGIRLMPAELETAEHEMTNMGDTIAQGPIHCAKCKDRHAAEFERLNLVTLRLDRDERERAG